MVDRNASFNTVSLALSSASYVTTCCMVSSPVSTCCTLVVIKVLIETLYNQSKTCTNRKKTLNEQFTSLATPVTHDRSGHVTSDAGDDARPSLCGSVARDFAEMSVSLEP